MLMSMNVFHQTTPKLLSSFHGRRRIPHSSSSSSSSSHALVSSPATAVGFKPKFLHVHGIQHSSCNPVLASPATMEFNPKFLHFLPCHGFSHSSCKPVLGSSATMKFGPVLSALPRDNQEFSSDNKEEEIVQEHEEDCTSISADNVNEEQLKKVSGTGEVKKLDFEVREATVLKEFRGSVMLKAEAGLLDCCHVGSDMKELAEEELELTWRKYMERNELPFMCIIAVRKEGEDVLNVIGTLDFMVYYIHPEQYGRISDVAVAESARGQGVGSRMLKFAIEHAKENGLRKVSVYPDRDNKRALALYTKMGFTILPKTTPFLEKNNQYACCIDL